MERQKPYGYIYKIEFPNGKVYIGLTTTSLKRRKSGHRKCAKGNDTRILYNALRKYTMEDTFELMEIDIAYTKEELCEKEILYIQMYNSFDKEYGYNMTKGGEGVNGWVRTQEQREKISEAIKKYYDETPGAREKNSEALKKCYKENPQLRKKISEANKKYYNETPGAREKASERGIKQFEKPGAREKASEKAIERFETPGAREKLSEIIKQHHEEHPETVKKMLDTKGCNKAFDVFTKDGTFIKSFTYQNDAIKYLKKEYNITLRIKISEVLNGYQKTSAGFMFKYKDEIPSTSES